MTPKEQRAFDNAARLVSPLGAFHFRGLSSLKAVEAGGVGKFHAEEMGDCTFHTAVLLTAMAIRYRSHPDPEQRQKTFAIIKKMMNYFTWTTTQNDGQLVRFAAKKDYYDKYPTDHKHGDAKQGLKDKSGGHMRYLPASYRGVDYMLRYDISPDLVALTISAMHWVRVCVPELADKARAICRGILDAYDKSGWMIRDKDTGDVLRYGVHLPAALNQMSSATMLLAEDIIGEERTTGWRRWLIETMSRFVRTWIVDVWRDKKTRNAWNGFILLAVYAAMNDAGMTKFKTAMRRIIKEFSGEMNLFAEAVNRRNPPVDSLMQFRDFHTEGAMPSASPVPLELRREYNIWEKSAYSAYAHRMPTPNDPPGNEDFLLAYWMGVYW